MALCCLIATAFQKLLGALDAAGLNTYEHSLDIVMEGAMGLQGLFLLGW
jgi:hypothetical protein